MKNIIAFHHYVLYLPLNTYKFLPPGILALLLFVNTLQGQRNCKLQMEKDGIQVYTCQRDDSGFNAIRASFEVNTTPAQYASIVLNVDDYQYWNYAATNPYVIARISDTELIYYTEAKAPWPVTDRYVVLHLKVTQDLDSKVMKVTLKNVPGKIPQQNGFIRMSEYYSTLEIIPIARNKVKISYFLKIDPGGKIPSWVVNLVSTKFPINTFSNFKKRVESIGSVYTKDVHN